MMMEAGRVIKRTWVVGVAAKDALGNEEGERAEDGGQEGARTPPKDPRKHTRPCVRDDNNNILYFMSSAKTLWRALQVHPRRASSTATDSRS